MFRRAAIFLFAVVCPISVFAQANGKLQIHYMDVGQGDGAVLISPRGEVVLFDDGVLNQCSKPIAYLQSLGVTKIDYHIASHYHSDHVGCAPSILAMFPLQKAAYDRGGSYTTATYAAYVNAVGAKRVTAMKGQSITLDAGSANPVTITFVVLNGNGLSTTDENDLSLVAVVRFGQFDAEFGGDLSGAATGAVDPDPDTPTACSYSVSPTTASASSTTGSVSVSVTTTSSCNWSASSGASWISVPASTSTGSGSVTLTVAANTGAARSGTATVAGTTVTVNQAAATTSCTYAASPTSGSATSAGGSLSVSVTTTTGCAWTTAPGASWLSVNPASGSGSGSATVTAQLNTGAARTGTATVAGRTITITQAAGSSTPAPTCCKTCSAGKPCGDTCIAASNTCHVGPGCACSIADESAYSVLPWINYTPVQGPMPDSVANIESGAASLVGQVEVYKVHHHGSKTSTNSTWLSVTTPKVGILSMSNANTYGHPTSEVLGRLHAAGVKTYWTSVGNGVAPLSGQDFVTTSGSIVVESAPASTTFTVRYGSTTDTYSVIGAATPAAPFGSFDTPSDGTLGITGSIAITGWALDDTGVAKVEILRDAHPNDPPGAAVNGRVFIGTATFVSGARPDLAGLYPSYPNASGGGWGYLMLTRGLIWDGQGAFNLYAVATDTQGNTTQLGTKRVTVTNSAATKPFGNIDTPVQGATVSGTFVNFGWVIALSGRTVPPANVQVAIDNVILPQVSECLTNRADITQGFPAFDTTQAIRCFAIDSTKFSNGLHTIGWLVTDSTGQADGIGSRFFTIANPAITTAAGSDVSASGSDVKKNDRQ